VIVSTPQEVALADARRGIEMFRRTQVPIIGLVENMSAYTDPQTGTVFAPFGRGGAEAAAADLGAPFLGEIPLDPRLAALSDAGTPPGRDPESPLGARFALLADLVWRALQTPLGKPAPTIRFV
jgi:ATP-binding protein involved in chromosome partitioning